MKFLRKLISPKTLLVLAIALVLGQCIDPSIAFATGEENETLKAFATLFSVFVNIFTFLSLVFLNYGGDLVGTEFLTTSAPMETIRPMWVIIRNITNVLFVLILLFLAFANLFSSFAGDGGNWTIKEKLPKVILALIAINFSLLGFKVVIDAVHVGTITIFAIPDSTLQAKGKNQLQDMLLQNVDAGEDGISDYKPFYEVMNNLMCGDAKWQGTEWSEEELNGQTGPFYHLKETLPDDCLFAIDPSETRVGAAKSKAAHNLFLAFGIQFQKLQELPSLAAKMNDWSDVFTSVLFVSILSLAQVVALAAVFIALLIRVVVLWIAMVFSPALIAAAIMGFGGGGGSGLGEKVITNLIMPLKIAAAFAVCFLMMDTMMSVGGPSGDFIKTGLSVSTFGATGYGLLWSIATIVVFWKAAFWALEGSAGEEIANKIKGGAESAGAFMARAGTIDREFFPMPGMGKDGKVAISNLYKSMTTGVVTAHKSKLSADYLDFAGPEGLGLIGEKATEAAKALDSLKTKIANFAQKEAFQETSDFVAKKGGTYAKENESKMKEVLLELKKKTPDTTVLSNIDLAISELETGTADTFQTAFAKVMDASKTKTGANGTDYKGTEKADDGGSEKSASYEITRAGEGTKIYLTQGDIQLNGGKPFTSLEEVRTYYNSEDAATKIDDDLKTFIREKQADIIAELGENDKDGNKKKYTFKDSGGKLDIQEDKK